MIAWCSYCQRFQGERPPFDSFMFTHGICPSCLSKGVLRDPQAVVAIKPVAQFFDHLRTLARTGGDIAATSVLARATELGIHPLDLLLGMIQPALYEIGELWARAEVTVAKEHLFSTNVESLVALVREQLPAAPPSPGRGGFLLVNAESNYHTLGVRMIEVMLRSAGRSVTAIVPGLPTCEIVGLVRNLHPAVIGLSIALLPQMRAVRELVEALDAFDAADRPRLVVGGLPVKTGLHPVDQRGFELVANPSDLLSIATA